MQGLSAGRVQSVATRLVVERERERMRFVAANYWDIVATFEPGAFDARLSAVDGRRVAQGRDFDQQGALRTADAVQLGEDDARALASALEGSAFSVSSVEEKPYTRRPAPPFMTSTLQQEASRKLRLSSQQTMRVAQRLYENGYITYMRTDSTTLSESALAAARDQARELYGAETVPAEPRQYTRKVKNAQEAHEAIRPAGDKFRTPDEVRRELSADEFNALRPDLEADGRVADGGRARADRLGAHHRHRERRAHGRVRDRRHRDHVPRLPARLRGRPRRAGDRRRGTAPAEARRRRRARRVAPRARTATRPRRRRGSPRPRS